MLFRSDEAEVAQGIKAALPVLGALSSLASEGHVLNGECFTLADCHLAPMVAYFVQAPEGAKAIANHPALLDWWDTISQRKSIQETEPGLPSR